MIKMKWAEIYLSYTTKPIDVDASALSRLRSFSICWFIFLYLSFPGENKIQ